MHIYECERVREGASDERQFWKTHCATKVVAGLRVLRARCFTRPPDGCCRLCKLSDSGGMSTPATGRNEIGGHEINVFTMTMTILKALTCLLTACLGKVFIWYNVNKIDINSIFGLKCKYLKVKVINSCIRWELGHKTGVKLLCPDNEVVKPATFLRWGRDFFTFWSCYASNPNQCFCVCRLCASHARRAGCITSRPPQWI